MQIPERNYSIDIPTNGSCSSFCSKRKTGRAESVNSPIESRIVKMEISEPLSYQKTISVKYNQDVKKYEGLPQEWRALLEMEPQVNEP